MHEEKNTITCQHFPLLNQKTSVADPNLDPDVFGPPPAPDPDPLERDTDPASGPDPSIIKQKIVRITLIFTGTVL